MIEDTTTALAERGAAAVAARRWNDARRIAADVLDRVVVSGEPLGELGSADARNVATLVGFLREAGRTDESLQLLRRLHDAAIDDADLAWMPPTFAATGDIAIGVAALVDAWRSGDDGRTDALLEPLVDRILSGESSAGRAELLVVAGAMSRRDAVDALLSLRADAPVEESGRTPPELALAAAVAVGDVDRLRQWGERLIDLRALGWWVVDLREEAAVVLAEASRPALAARLLHATATEWSLLGATRAAARARARLRRVGPIRVDDVDEVSNGWDTLTPAEWRVVELVAQDLTYREVAEKLLISRRTVETHVAHVFRKLGVHGRGELVERFRRDDAGGHLLVAIDQEADTAPPGSR